MLQAQLEIFFRLPSEGNLRVLHPARVLSATPRACTAELHEAIKLEPGQEMLVYYKHSGKFYQRPIQVTALSPGSGEAKTPVVAFTLLGDAVSANSRECFRVATGIAGLTAQLGEEKACPVMDVSATGFSIISKSAHRIGAQVSVTFLHEGAKYSGMASVQSTRDLGRGRTRYGMFCLTGRGVPGNLAQGLAAISASYQRAQLRRIARDAAS
jgi:hypothetical protein